MNTQGDSNISEDQIDCIEYAVACAKLELTCDIRRWKLRDCTEEELIDALIVKLIQRRMRSSEIGDCVTLVYK